jgi:hypothetical protein
VTDLSPNTNTGALSTSPPTLDTTDGIESFKFDASSNQYISSSTPISGNYVHTMSMWFKPTNLTATSGDAILFVGDNTDNNKIEVFMESDRINYTFKANDYQAYTQFLNNVWHHLTLTYNGQAGQNGREIYLNGEKLDGTHSGNSAVLAISNNALDLGRYTPSGTSTAYAFDGSIANFRLYSKALNAGQVQELYDYQKDYFLGSKSQVTLYKGHLGVGVTEPSGQLELAGDERIQEYPPRGFGVFAEDPDYSTHIEGHGVFTAYGSSQDNTGKSYSVIGAFDKTVSPDNSCWLSATNTYSGGLPASSAAKINGVSGEWCALQCPYPIKLQSFTTRVRSASSGENGRMAKSGIIWGSNDGATWYQVHSWGGRVYSDTNSNYFEVNSTEYYSHHAFQATELQGSSTATTLGEWRLFGTPGPTTLDKGSLTLGRSLDVPRVSRYDVDTETPRPEKLVLDFDTTVNSSPTDISGQGNHGRFVGTAQYSPADKAFTGFPSSSANYITGNILGASGAYAHTQSYWINGVDATPRVAFTLGAETGNYSYANLYWYTGSGAGWVLNTDGAAGASWVEDIQDNRWYHVVLTYDGGSSTSSWKFYLDGEYKTPTTMQANAALSLASNPEYRIGRNNGTQWYNGMVSNPKVYSVALEPSEVKKLYNLGRTGRSMVISDTAVGIGKVPEAQLDVRGSLVVRGGNVMIQEDTVSVKLKTNPGYSSLISGGSMFIANPSTSGGYEHFIMNNSTTGNHQTTYFSFRRNNGQIGSILTSSGSTINFNTGSDYRLKENIVPMSNEGLVVINKLQPKTFNFKTNPGETVYGFIAHELQEHIPMAVSGEKDEMRGEEPMYQGVDASKIVPYLVKAVQELYEENQTLKTRLDTLEGASNVVAEEETSNVA